MATLMQKLASRKLWLAIAGVATGVAMALGASQSEISTVAGAVTAIVSVLNYIITEGRIDAAAVRAAAETAAAVQAAVEAVKASGKSLAAADSKAEAGTDTADAAAEGAGGND